MTEAISFDVSPITDEHVRWACHVMGLPSDAFAGPDGNDPRQEAIKALSTLDVEACPGSGKTTLLVAKLAILANGWTSRSQGICVLSHTNAARNEIGQRLSLTTAGHALLRYPHFIGTIHSFVNEFLALPWLRSQGRPIRTIDDEITLVRRWRELPFKTRAYLENRKHKGPGCLEYERLDLTGAAMDEFPVGKIAHTGMWDVIKASAAAGDYCFDEMFVWATELIDRHPVIVSDIRARFPLLFVDEVQDSSEQQSAFLHRLFMAGTGPVIRQRLGDQNQTIYRDKGGSVSTTDPFPGPVNVNLPNSFRFGQGIATMAAPLGVRQSPLFGKGPTTARVLHASGTNALFLFDDASALHVLPRYAQYLMSVFSEEAIARGHFTAVAGVHRSEKNDHMPRFMGHYAPDYDPVVATPLAVPKNLAQYCARARAALALSSNASPVSLNLGDAVLHYARQAGGAFEVGVRKGSHRHLLESLPTEERAQYLDLLDRLIMVRCAPTAEEWRIHVAPAMNVLCQSIVGKLPPPADAREFLRWQEVAHAQEGAALPNPNTSVFHYPAADPKVRIHLSSIHRVKGETHTATLVLESYRSAHHLKTLLPWLCGKRPSSRKANDSEESAMQERLRLHYVAMTRPSHLLCLAMRSDAVDTQSRDALSARGWHLINCGDSS